jgi:5-methylcytosine-specific restriction endonuclease McrA
MLPLSEYHRWNKGRDGRTADCKTCRNALTNAWKQLNPEKAHAQSKRWRANNLEKAKAQCLITAKRSRERRRESDPEGYAEYQRQYNIRNRERKSAQTRAWRAKNPDRSRENAMRAWYKRWARFKAVEHEDLDRWDIYERDGARCYLCGEDIHRKDFELDHIIPLAKGGGHIRGNVAATHKSCNRSKGAKEVGAVRSG